MAGMSARVAFLILTFIECAVPLPARVRNK
jgi:hypothetical protein